MKKMRFQWAALAVSAAVLTACGGGGDDESAEGFWEASVSNGKTVRLAVLENGDTWGIFTNSSGDIVEAFNGRTTVNGANVQGSVKAFDLVDEIASDDTFSGSVRSKSTLSVTANNGVNYQASYLREYEQPALLSNIEGYFTGTGHSVQGAEPSTSVDVAANGSFNAYVGLNCEASGTFSPRSSGKNVFDVSATFSGLGCALGDGTATQGVAYYDTDEQTLLILALNADRTNGFIYTGTKGSRPN